MTYTRTYTTLRVSKSTYDEIAEKLGNGNRTACFHDDGSEGIGLDMQNIVLALEKPKELEFTCRVCGEVKGPHEYEPNFNRCNDCAEAASLPRTKRTCRWCGYTGDDPKYYHFDRSWPQPTLCSQCANDYPWQISMQPVKSSLISAVSYDAMKRNLYLEFKDGKFYVYRGVTGTVAQNFLDSESRGKFFNQEIKGRYHEKRVIEATD